MSNDATDRLSAFAYEPDFTYGYTPNINGVPLAPDSAYEPYRPWDEYSSNKPYTSIEDDPMYQAWIKERGAPPGYAALWQEACADFFFLQECDGVCSTCTQIKRFKGGLK